jgi:hypothetical protein
MWSFCAPCLQVPISLIGMCGRSEGISDPLEADVGLYRRTDNSCEIRHTPSDVLRNPVIKWIYRPEP